MVARKQSSKERAGAAGNYFAKQQEGIEFFPSGCKTLDLALGGGWAKDRVGNIIGDNSTGKTLLAIEGATNFMIKYRNGKVRYREREQAFDETYAEAIGMPVSKVDFGDQSEEEPYDTVEDIYDEIDWRCKQGNDYPQLFVVDSLDAFTSEAEKARKIDEASYAGEKAKKMSELFRRKIGDMKRAQITLHIISQTRDKIGVTFGKKYTRSGGKALDFYASQIVYLAHVENIWKGPQGQAALRRPVGNHIKAKMDKNKVGLPFRTCDFNILYGFGIDDFRACLDWAKSAGCENEIFGNMKRQAWINWAEKLEGVEYRKMMSEVHKVVEDRWWEIEKNFLPTRRKYG